MAVDGTMKAWLDASRSQIERGTLAALREHVSDNSGILPPFRLPALARDIVHEMTRFLADEPARSGADAAGAFGEALAGLGLGLRSWLAVGRALARELVGDGATDRTALQIRLHEFVTWAVDGIARHQMAAISRQRDEMHAALERVIQAREDELRRVIQELSTPVIPVHRKILVLPLIGAVDDERARRITERLLEETALFLHRVVSELPAPKRRMLEELHQTDEALVGKQVLVVDDDVRNIFALSSLLERRGMSVLVATNGQEAIRLIQSTPALSIVLMDIMMPEMDGYETMRAIRQDARFRLLPIIALTAKAMKGDREKCLEAGASDYIAKPVNTEQLVSLLRIWLHR